MSYPIVKIGGQTVLSSSPVRWSIRSGVSPVVETFDVDQDAAKFLEDSAPGPVELSIEAKGTRLVFKKIYVINISPGENRNIFKVTVADRRYWWSYAHVNKAYNVRRNVGYRRIQANDQQANAFVVPKQWYARWSMKIPGATPPNGLWTAQDVLIDVVKRASRQEKKRFGSGPRVSVFDGIPAGRQIPIENLEIDDTGNNAVGRVFKYVPEAELYVDPEGNVIVYSRVTGREKGIHESALPEKVGRGHVEVVSNASSRPKAVRVLFTREVEVRFNFLEPGDGATVTTDLGDRREVHNVLPIPDYQLTVDGEKLPQGTWITVDQALAAWNADQPPPLIGRLTQKLIRRAFVPFMDLWAALDLAGQRVPNVNWSARLAALQQHWRRTFRINQRWVDRTSTFRDYRVAIVDPSTGSRAPAMAWADHCLLPSQRGLWTAQAAGARLPYCVNVKGYPADNDNLDSSSKAAPARVTILDHDQGIIHIDYLIDPYRTYEQVLPSMMSVNGSTNDAAGYPNIPGADAGIRKPREFPISYDSVAKGSSRFPTLTTEHKAAVVMTLVPASRNNDNEEDGNLHLEEVVVKPQDVADMLPPAAAEGLRAARGPVMEVRVGTGVEPARIQWLGSRMKDIEQIFGIPDPSTPPDTAGLVLNKEQQVNIGTQGASLIAIARAVAARVYAGLADRLEGGMSTDLNPNLRPGGWLDEVAFEVSPTGETSSVLRFPEQVPQMSMFAFLDASTRSIIMRLTQP